MNSIRLITTALVLLSLQPLTASGQSKNSENDFLGTWLDVQPPKKDLMDSKESYTFHSQGKLEHKLTTFFPLSAQLAVYENMRKINPSLERPTSDDQREQVEVGTWVLEDGRAKAQWTLHFQNGTTTNMIEVMSINSDGTITARYLDEKSTTERHFKKVLSEAKSSDTEKLNQDGANKDTVPVEADPFKAMSLKYKARTDGFPFGKFNLEKNFYYEVNPIGEQLFYVAQQGVDVLMAADLNHELCAVLIFENSKAIESLRIRHNAEASAIGKFVGYKDIPMQRGDTKHLPIFSCVGLKVWDTGFVNTEGTQPKQTSEPGELKQGPVGATDVGPSIKKAQTTQTTDSDSDEGSGRTTTYIILIGAFAIGYFAVKKMRARTLSRASTIAAILGGIVFSIILTVAIDKFQRGEWSLRGSGPISSVNVVSHQHAMKNAHYVPGKVQVTWNVRLKNEASQPISHITVKYSWLGKNDEELAWGTNGVTNLEGGESITVGGERIMEEQLYRQVAKVRVKMSTREQETKTNTFAVTTEDDSTEGHLKGGRPPK